MHTRIGSVDDNAGFWLAKLGDKEIHAEPTLRDVCAVCNNGVLSKLDAYICQLYDSELSRVIQRHEKVILEYDYHLLKRWLLKMCFNSARISQSVDHFVFPQLMPYIMGHSTSAGSSVQLYVQLSYPGRIPDHLLGPSDEHPMIYEPVANRVGHYWFAPPGIGKKLLRAIHLRSYTFLLAFFEPTERRAEIEYFTKVFLALSRHTKLLQASLKQVELVCDAMDAWESFYEARHNKITTTAKGSERL